MGETNEDVINMAFALKEIDADSIRLISYIQLRNEIWRSRLIVTNEMFANYSNVSFNQSHERN